MGAAARARASSDAEEVPGGGWGAALGAEPVQVFRGVWRLLFTFVIPVALMTTYPAMALLGRMEARTALLSIGGALAFATMARLLWRAAIGSYTSASS